MSPNGCRFGFSGRVLCGQQYNSISKSSNTKRIRIVVDVVAVAVAAVNKINRTTETTAVFQRLGRAPLNPKRLDLALKPNLKPITHN